MKVWIDQDLCTGDGLCEEIAPRGLHPARRRPGLRQGGRQGLHDPGGAEGWPSSPPARKRPSSSPPRSAPASASSSRSTEHRPDGRASSTVGARSRAHDDWACGQLQRGTARACRRRLRRPRAPGRARRRARRWSARRRSSGGRGRSRTRRRRRGRGVDERAARVARAQPAARTNTSRSVGACPVDVGARASICSAIRAGRSRSGPPPGWPKTRARRAGVASPQRQRRADRGRRPAAPRGRGGVERPRRRRRAGGRRA